MGFTILNFSLDGLQPQSFYISIQGNYMINKTTGPASLGIPGGSSAGLNMPGVTMPYYSVSFTVYYAASKNTPVIIQRQMLFTIGQLPEPANIYPMIYNHIKKIINPDDIQLDIIDEQYERSEQ